MSVFTMRVQLLQMQVTTAIRLFATTTLVRMGFDLKPYHARQYRKLVERITEGRFTYKNDPVRGNILIDAYSGRELTDEEAKRIMFKFAKIRAESVE